MLDQISINSHSSIRVEAEKIIYFDPFRIKESTSDADIIFVTHDHYDHYSPEDIKKIIKDDTIIVAPKVAAGLAVTDFGLSSDRIVVANAGDTLEVSGFPVEVIASYNPNKPFHPKEQKFVGYVVTIGSLRYYVCGDMDITEEAKAVSCDVLLLPCGGKYTMDADEAAELVGILRPKYAIPTHYASIVGGADCGKIFEKKVKKTSPETEVIIKIG